jgi:integrase
MPYQRVPAFYQDLEKIGTTTARALQLKILSATRTQEVIGAMWTEFEDDVWTIPAKRMKGRKKKEHRVPLSPQMKAILALLEKDSPYLFPGRSFAMRSPKPLSKKSMLRLMRAMGEIAATPHGFRSSFYDWAHDQTDAPLEIIEQCLAHALGNATTRAYLRSDAFEKRRKVMDWWGQYCDSAKTKRPIQDLLKLVAES